MALRFVTAGESHGPALTAILEGMPAGLALAPAELAIELQRRQTGSGTGDRLAKGIENDAPQIMAGVMNGVTTGAPIAMQIVNRDHQNWKGRSVTAYAVPRPGHADLAAAIKYGYDDFRYSLERASARETAARVAVGGVCRKLLSTFGISVGGYVASIGGVNGAFEHLSFEERVAAARSSMTGCPDPEASQKIDEAIDEARAAGDTLGGVLEVMVVGLPVGLGSFATWEQRLDSRLAAAVMGLPAQKAFEIGEALSNTERKGTKAHDQIRLDGSHITRTSNRSGGLEGGITNGLPLVVRSYMKPISTTLTSQKSVNIPNNTNADTVYERSDICPVPRAVVIIEAAVCYVLAGALLEKLGGDSIEEMRPRFDALRKLDVNELNISAEDKVFWP